MAAKRFRLSMINAAEDVPRLIRAYGRACDGEFALVLRPPQARGTLVLIQPVQKGGQSWKWSTEEGFAPTRPSEPIKASEAVALVKAEQKNLPRPGPITLRGQWSGYLYCEGGAPRIEMTRKLASYAVLTISSDPTDGRVGWRWKIERTAKWFSTPNTEEGRASTLLQAIEAGLKTAMGLLGEACSHRDTSRRAAFDEDWSTRHPIKPAREHKRNPLDRLKSKVPRSKTALKKQAKAIERDARAVQRDAASPAPSEASVEPVRRRFAESVIPGFLDVADRINKYAHGQSDEPIPVDEFLRTLQGDVQRLLKEDGHNTTDRISKEAMSWLDTLDAALKTAPSLLARTRGLIDYANAAVDSPKCSGVEEAEAREAITKAETAYADARLAFMNGAERQALRKLRQSAEWLALSAARVSASCRSGQMSLTAGMKSRSATPSAKEQAPTSFTYEVPKIGSKKASFAKAQEAIITKLSFKTDHKRMSFYPPKRGSWTLAIEAKSKSVASQIPGILETLRLEQRSQRSVPQKSKRKPRKPAPTDSSRPLSAKKTRLLQQAFSTAIADVVQQLKAGASQ